MFFVRKFLCLAMMLAVVAGCQQKKETKAESNLPAKDTQSQVAQTPPPPPAQSVSEPKYDYTDIKDVEMDGRKAIGKTCQMKIMMDYSGIEEGTFRAYSCNRGEMYSGVNFRMSFGPSTKSEVRNLKSMECGGTAVFKITGKGRLENFTARLIELSSY